VNVGVGLAVGILMDTFVVRTVLVPCTVVLLGRWNWWPSQLEVTPETTDAADAVGASADALGLSGAAADPEATDSEVTDSEVTDNESRRNS